MSEEGFFKRWARLKATGGPDDAGVGTAPAPAPVPAVPVARAPAQPAALEPATQAPLPTLEDVARLTPDADFSAFMAKGVDKSVQRLALKKLFTDPHFNSVDMLDVYMNDYNVASPLSPVMLASLQHAQGMVARLLDDQRQEAEALLGLAEPNDKTEAPAIEAPPTTEQGTA